MKLTILFALLILAFGCGSGTNKPVTADSDELMADILTRSAGNKAIIEITFYRDLAEDVNGKTNKGFGKSVVSVQDPLFNGAAMTNATNLSDQPIYKTDAGNAKATNVITASVGGKTFETTTMLETKLINKMTTVTLSKVEKGGS